MIPFRLCRQGDLKVIEVIEKYAQFFIIHHLLHLFFTLITYFMILRQFIGKIEKQRYL